MSSLKGIDTSTLVDMLEVQMAEFYQLTRDGASRDRTDACFLKVKAIQNEIERRKKKYSPSDRNEHLDGSSDSAEQKNTSYS